MNLLNNCDWARHNQFYVRKKRECGRSMSGYTIKSNMNMFTDDRDWSVWRMNKIAFYYFAARHFAYRPRQTSLSVIAVRRCVSSLFVCLSKSASLNTNRTLNNSIYFYLILCCDYKIHFLSFVLSLSLSSVYICLWGWMYIWFICVFSSVEMMRVHKSMCSLLFANDFFRIMTHFRYLYLPSRFWQMQKGISFKAQKSS